MYKFDIMTNEAGEVQTITMSAFSFRGDWLNVKYINSFSEGLYYFTVWQV